MKFEQLTTLRQALLRIENDLGSAAAELPGGEVVTAAAMRVLIHLHDYLEDRFAKH